MNLTFTIRTRFDWKPWYLYNWNTMGKELYVGWLFFSVCYWKD